LVRTFNIGNFENMRSILAALGLCLVTAFPAAADEGEQARIRAECKVMERAYQLTLESKGDDRPWIMNGCPGHRVVKNPREGSGLTTMQVLSGGVPKAVKPFGKWGKVIYQRMQFQGVPVAVAKAVATTPEFAAAVAVYQETTGEK
jgi:hypothetical protein